jgi:hypothetical protein
VFEWLKKFLERRGFVGNKELRGDPLTMQTKKMEQMRSFV